MKNYYVVLKNEKEVWITPTWDLNNDDLFINEVVGWYGAKYQAEEAIFAQLYRDKNLIFLGGNNE